jgi:hypothetical protein
MRLRISAIYENGVLRLKDSLPLPDGTPVRIIVVGEEGPGRNGRTPAAILGDIAALPMQSGASEFTGREHDRVLSGDQGKP